MKKKLLYWGFLGILAFGLAGCGKYESVSTKGDVASGQAVKTKKSVEEPTVQEVEQAYHRAIQHDVYEHGERDEEFSGRKMDLYKIKEKDGYTYYLVDKKQKKDGHGYTNYYDLHDGETYYNFDMLRYYTDCEEPGFETESYFDYGYSEEDIKEELEGAEKIAVLAPWKCEANKKPDYLQMSKVTLKMVNEIKNKVKEEAAKYCVVAERKNCHVYIPQFVPADREVCLLLVVDEEKGEKKAGVCEVYFELNSRISYSDVYGNLIDLWTFRSGTYPDLESEYAFGEEEKEAIAHAMTDFTFTLEPQKALWEWGLSDEIQQQIKLISQRKNIWCPKDFGSGTLKYMISDLNQNGRLEIVTYMAYSRNAMTEVYEVSEDGKKLVKCRNNFSGEAKQLFLAENDNTDVYYNSSKGAYYYKSQTRYSDVKGVRESDGDFCLQGNALKQRIFDMGKFISGENFDEIKGYFVKDKKVSKEAYDAAVNKHWSGTEKKQASFGWRSAGTATKNMEEKELEIRFVLSWLEFGITG